MNTTTIEWTERTWNPMTGCSHASPGCDNCYAKRMAQRLRGRCGYDQERPFQVKLRPERLAQPLLMKKPSMIFVCSMGDLFHEEVPDLFICAVFAVMAACPQHTFQVLTKRPERALRWFGRVMNVATIQGRPWVVCRRAAVHYKRPGVVVDDHWVRMMTGQEVWPLPNVWLGVSAENQEAADARIPTLLQTPAAVRFVSCEPLLGPIRLGALSDGSWHDQEGADYYSALSGVAWWSHGENGLGGGPKLDWVIVGGETGPGPRPMTPKWARDIRNDSVSWGVPFMFKQWGGRKNGKDRVFYGRTWDEMPEVVR